GRLVVLGSGRERVADALARRHGAVAFVAGDGKAQCTEGLDDPAVDPDLLALAARHLPGALRRAHLGARLCRRTGARYLHSADPLRFHRWQPDAVCRSRLVAEAGWAVRADLARGRAGAQQSVPDHGLRHRVCWHAVSDGAGDSDRRQDLGRGAVFQPDLRTLVRAVDDRDAFRADAGLEA